MALPSIFCFMRSNNYMSMISFQRYEQLLQSCSMRLTSCRNYRGHRVHNIGRIHGLEKIKPPETPQRLVGIWKPEKYAASKENAYDTLNFVVSGYDMVLVESFAKFVHRLMIKQNLDVIETYALPSNDVDVKKMITVTQKKVDEMVNDITLTVHRRVVQVNNIPSHVLSVLIQALMFHVPQSVQFNIKKHDEEQHFLRYQRRLELERERENYQRLKDSK